MAKGKLIEQLDDAVEAIMASPDAPLESIDPRLEAILRIAGDLRDLPSADFKEQLKAELAVEAVERASTSVGGKPLITEKDIRARIEEMRHESKFTVYDVRAALSDLPDMSMRFFAPLNQTTMIVSRGTRKTHWERHMGGDELIYVMDGATDIVTLTEGGPVRSTVRAGELFTCPEGLWHRLTPQPSVSAFYLTPSERTEGSAAKDPRGKRDRRQGKSRKKAIAPKLQAIDLTAAMDGLQELKITEQTTEAEADAAVRNVGRLNQLTLGVMRYSGLTPWERHPDGDEMLLALAGEVEVTVLTDEGPLKRTIRAGEVFTCPQGLWHRQFARDGVTILYGTPTETSEASFADDPRAPREAASPAAAAAKKKINLTPSLLVPRTAEMIDFLKTAFGAEEIMRAGSGDHFHAEVKIGDSIVELGSPVGQFRAMPTAMHLFVKDTDKTYKRALRAGGRSIHKPMEQDYGERSAAVKDAWGNNWYIATPHADAEPAPEGLHNVTPYLHPKKAEKVINFMKSAFDAEEIFRVQDEAGTVHHAKIRVGDSIIEMGEAHGPYRPMPTMFHLEVGDIDAVYRHSLEVGGVSVTEPEDKPWGMRSACVRDPGNNIWAIATRIEDLPRAASVVESEPVPTQGVSHGVMPFVYIAGVSSAIEFYKRVFDASVLMRHEEPSGIVSHAQLKIGETRIMLSDPTSEDVSKNDTAGLSRTPKSYGGSPVHLYVYVKDVDTAMRRALEAGAKMIQPLENQNWGDRCGGIEDPFGHVWYIATSLKDLPKRDSD